MAAEEADLSIFAVLVLTLVFGALGTAIFLVFRPKPSKENEESSDDASETELPPEKPKAEPKPAATTKKKSTSGGGKDTISHPLLLANLKGHTGNVLGLDFSSNGKHLASCSEGDLLFVANSVRDIWTIDLFGKRAAILHNCFAWTRSIFYLILQ